MVGILQTHLLEWKCSNLNEISLSFALYGPTENTVSDNDLRIFTEGYIYMRPW